MEKKLSVRLYGQPLGVLKQTLSGKMEFSYDEAAQQALSLSMPIRSQSYGSQICEAFFGGLLPESEVVRKILGRRYSISHNNSFALLKAIGYDCAGAVSLHDMAEPVNEQRFFTLSGEVVSENALYEHIKALPQKPLFLDVKGMRLSLAGVQDKAAVCIVDQQIVFPEKGCPTTHILKPAGEFEGIVFNEYFCLKIAARVGLKVPQIELRQIKDINYLLVERYDRRIQNRQVERIHQEDFCQALAVVTVKKYQNEGGPGFKDCFALLNSTTQPAINRNRLVAIMIFNFLCCNMDAHGKNFSLLHNDASDHSLAPSYDLLCTRVYDSLTSKMAMKIGSKYIYTEVLPRHWEQFCIDINYSFPALKKLIKKQGEAILKAMENEKDHLIHTQQCVPIIDKIINLLKPHIERTLMLFS